MMKRIFLLGLGLSAAAFAFVSIDLYSSLRDDVPLNYFYFGTGFWQRWIGTLLFITNLVPIALSIVVIAVVGRFIESGQLEMAVFVAVTIGAMAAWWYLIARAAVAIAQRMGR